MAKVTPYAAARSALALALGLIVAGFAAQSAALSNTELRKLGATANTAAQHRRLAAHYHFRAVEHEGDAKAHETIAKMAVARTSDKQAAELARFAARYVEYSHRASEIANELARLHEAMASRAGR